MIEPSFAPNDKLWDVCVIGSGPVGLSVAFECEARGLSVLLLESGGYERGDTSRNAGTAKIVDPLRHAPMELASNRALGGTSWTWGGRCVPFDDVDFVERGYVPESGWPLEHDEIRPWYDPAVRLLACGSAVFEAQPSYIGDLGPNVSVDTLERWSSNGRLGRACRSRLGASTSITCCLTSTLVDLAIDPASGAVESAAVVSNGHKGEVTAKCFVLALGGIETTRMLLAIQENHGELFGGRGGPLGRYYMGHISGKIASIQFNRPEDVRDLDFFLDENASWARRRFLLRETVLNERQLLNTAFWPDNAPFYDSGHRSGVLSAVFLALAIPAVGRRILPEAIRLAHTGPRPLKLGGHIRNVALGAPQAVSDLLTILRQRFIDKPKKPGFLVHSDSGRFALHYHAEQEPNPESRITLDNERDQFGLKRAVIDFRFTPQDFRSVVNAHRVLDEALRSSGSGQLHYWWDDSLLEDKVSSQASDGYHQAGTTRMGCDPTISVVNKDLRTHDLVNLFVASSSIFPTTGQANSTLLAVALGFRLANHIAEKLNE
jgi:choline dehydrogenase-like flavoprotein